MRQPPPRPLRSTGNDEHGERLCPFGDGRHKRRPWAERGPGGQSRSGLACVRCSKTWEWTGPGQPVETYRLING